MRVLLFSTIYVFLALSSHWGSSQIHHLGTNVYTLDPAGYGHHGITDNLFIEADPAGNLVLAGPFIFSVRFDNQILYQKPASFLEDIYLGKYSVSSKQLEWNRYFGGRFNDLLTSMKVGPKGEIVLSGVGAGYQKFGGISFYGSGDTTGTFYYPDYFLTKISSEGVTEWLHHGRGNNGFYSLDFDEDGNVVFSGNFLDSLEIDGNSLHALDSQERVNYGSHFGGDIILGKVDFAGALKWAHVLGGHSQDFVDWSGVSNNQVYLTGNTSDSVFFLNQYFEDFVSVVLDSSGLLVNANNVRNRKSILLEGGKLPYSEDIVSVQIPTCNTQYLPPVGTYNNDYALLFRYKNGIGSCPDLERNYFNNSQQNWINGNASLFADAAKDKLFAFLRNDAGFQSASNSISSPFGIGKLDTGNIEFDWIYGLDYNARIFAESNGFIYLADTFSGIKSIEGSLVSADFSPSSGEKSYYLSKYLDCSSFMQNASIKRDGDTLMGPFPEFHYSWFKDLIPIGNSQKIISPGNGFVFYEVRDPDSLCISYSDSLLITGEEEAYLSDEIYLTVFPNPTRGSSNYFVYNVPQNQLLTLEITDLKRQVWKSVSGANPSGSIETENLPAGVYVVTAKWERGKSFRRIVKR